jgi:hypothetical protein
VSLLGGSAEERRSRAIATFCFQSFGVENPRSYRRQPSRIGLIILIVTVGPICEPDQQAKRPFVRGRSSHRTTRSRVKLPVAGGAKATGLNGRAQSSNSSVLYWHGVKGQSPLKNTKFRDLRFAIRNRLGVSTQTLSSVRRVQILLRSNRHDSRRIDIVVRVVVMAFDVIEVHRLSNPWLLIEIL